MKSAEQIALEAQLAAGAAAQTPDDASELVHRTTVTRADALERLRYCEEEVDRLADKIIQAEREGRRKKVRRAYSRAVELQAEANDLQELLDFGRIVRRVES